MAAILAAPRGRVVGEAGSWYDVVVETLEVAMIALPAGR